MTSSRLRHLTLLIFVVSALGCMFDLVLLGHFSDARQWTPLLVLSIGLLMLAWQQLQRDHVSTRAFQGAMVLFIVAGFAGVWFHYSGNARIALQILPSMDLWTVARESLSGPAPTLAPATLAQLGLLGLAYTYRHPFLERAARRRHAELRRSRLAEGLCSSCGKRSRAVTVRGELASRCRWCIDRAAEGKRTLAERRALEEARA